MPPDPECMNERRSAWADAAVRLMISLYVSDQESVLRDLLANLMHWADRHDRDFTAELARALDHYAAETSTEAT